MKPFHLRTYAKMNDYCSNRRVGSKQVCDALLAAGLVRKEVTNCGRRNRYDPTNLATDSGALSPYTGRNSGLQWNIRALDHLLAFGVLPEKAWKPDLPPRT